MANRECTDFAHRLTGHKMPPVGSSGVGTANSRNTSTGFEANLISTNCAIGSNRIPLNKHIQSRLKPTVSAIESKRFFSKSTAVVNAFIGVKRKH